MGANASQPGATAAAAPPTPPPHPLHPSHPLPADPDAPIYRLLFHYYERAALPPLAPLLAHPHLALTTRATTARLRAHVHALSVGHPPPFPPPETLAALRFSAAVLRALSLPPPRLYDLLGTLDAAADIPLPDRLDIGHSLLWQLASASLDCLALPLPLHAASRAIPRAALALLLLLLSDDVRPAAHALPPLASLLDSFARAPALLRALLDAVAAAAPREAALLEDGCVPTPAARAPNVAPSALSLAASAALANARVGVGLAALAASASASANTLHAGVNDALAALSARLPLRRAPAVEGGGEAEADVRVPHPLAEPYTYFEQEQLPAGREGADGVVETPKPNGNGSPSPVPAADPGGGGGKQEGRKGLAEDRATAGRPEGEGGAQDDPNLPTESPTVLAEQVWALLAVLCGPREGNPFRKALFELQDVSKAAPDLDRTYSFSKLYQALGKWMAYPRAALVGYYLVTRNRRFRTFALSRTDPDVLLVPLLASLRRRCVLGSTVADAYIPASIVLTLTSDKGFCEAIDVIKVPMAWLTYIEDRSRLGSEPITLSGVVLLVCARVIQQSLVLRRRMPECFMANTCLAIMANVSADVTNLHSLVAERLVSLVEFLARRRRKAALLSRHSKEMPKAPPRVVESPRTRSDGMSRADAVGAPDLFDAASAKVSSFEKSADFLDRLSRFIGMALEIIVCVLRSRSVVSVNRHLVYTLLHREAVLDMDEVSRCSVKSEALIHMLRRMVDFFGKYIDDTAHSPRHGAGVRSSDAGGTGISVERVFQIIEKQARHLPSDVFEGLPESRFEYEEVDKCEEFLKPYSWALATRGSEALWSFETASVPIEHEKFQICM